jgi:FdhD protein
MNVTLPGTARTVQRQQWQGLQVHSGNDAVAVEAPIAMVYNGISHVVMMATPDDLEDFALGFSLTEGIIDRPDQLLELDVELRDEGIALSMRIGAEQFQRLKLQRRNLTGRTGCGLCGAESLEQAMPALPQVDTPCQLSHQQISAALLALQQQQPLKQLTGAVHGAAFCNDKGDIQLVREDVGRHNALDKLLGAMARQQIAPAGAALVTSRASYELIAKAARAGVPILAAVSAPTSLAIELADQAQITLMGFVSEQRQVIYTHPARIEQEA